MHPAGLGGADRTITGASSRSPSGVSLPTEYPPSDYSRRVAAKLDHPRSGVGYGGLADEGRAKPAEAGAPERPLQPASGNGRGLVQNSYSADSAAPALDERIFDDGARVLDGGITMAIGAEVKRQEGHLLDVG